MNKPVLGITHHGRAEAGRQLFSPQQTFFQWHGEGFTLPQGAELLAGSASFPQQAFRYGGNVFGTQFHPEVSPSRPTVGQAWALIGTVSRASCMCRECYGKSRGCDN